MGVYFRRSQWALSAFFERQKVVGCTERLVRSTRLAQVKDLTHFLKVVSAEMKNETPKVVEIAIRTFQNSLFLCFYMLETATVVF